MFFAATHTPHAAEATIGEGMMGESLDVERLRTAVKAGRIEWQRHALERMAERGITTADVKAALVEGDRIEDYPDAYPLPAALLLGWLSDQPLHAVVAFDPVAATAYLITAYQPSPEHFESDFRTRRKS
jgi:hypothetical protein